MWEDDEVKCESTAKDASLYPHVTVLNHTANISQTVITLNYS